jgi:hypothetical protein
MPAMVMMRGTNYKLMKRRRTYRKIWQAYQFYIFSRYLSINENNYCSGIGGYSLVGENKKVAG